MTAQGEGAGQMAERTEAARSSDEKAGRQSGTDESAALLAVCAAVLAAGILAARFIKSGR